jgi:hypothetical protein
LSNNSISFPSQTIANIKYILKLDNISLNNTTTYTLVNTILCNDKGEKITVAYLNGIYWLSLKLVSVNEQKPYYNIEKILSKNLKKPMQVIGYANNQGYITRTSQSILFDQDAVNNLNSTYSIVLTANKNYKYYKIRFNQTYMISGINEFYILEDLNSFIVYTNIP